MKTVATFKYPSYGIPAITFFVNDTNQPSISFEFENASKANEIHALVRTLLAMNSTNDIEGAPQFNYTHSIIDNTVIVNGDLSTVIELIESHTKPEDRAVFKTIFSHIFNEDEPEVCQFVEDSKSYVLPEEASSSDEGELSPELVNFCDALKQIEGVSSDESG